MAELRTADPLQVEHPILSTEDEPLLPAVESSPGRAGGLHALDWRQVLAGGLILAGLMTLGIGWWGISGTTKTYQQLTYLLSGGLFGAAFIAIGGFVLIAYQHHADRLALIELERRIAGEFDVLYSKLGRAGIILSDRPEDR